MAKIQVLDRNTIDKIAAGEVIERPSSIVKELTENAVDAGASSVTVEIRDGGTTFLRVTDNGSGIAADQVADAFLRHSTSKIRKVEDLAHISSLGFRGEALSSIASVSQVELITKTADSDTGVSYRIEGGEEKSLEEIGAPEGTTFLIRNLFYNVPARRKFLKSPMTEAGYIGTLMERLALSHPDISFKFIANHQTKLQTSGNTNLKDIIYNIYGREVASELLPVNREGRCVSVTGYIGKPVVSRGNRNYENYFVNGRYVKNPTITKAIEDAYKSFMMQHRYPFTALLFQVDGEKVDVNVHPAKLEVRFSDNNAVYQDIFQAVHDALAGKEFIPEIVLTPEEEQMFAPEQKRTPGGQTLNGQAVSQTASASIADTQMPSQVQTGDRTVIGQTSQASVPPNSSMVREISAYGTEHFTQQGQATDTSTPSQPQSPQSAMTPEEAARQRNLQYFMEKMKERVTKEFAQQAAKVQESQTEQAATGIPLPEDTQMGAGYLGHLEKSQENGHGQSAVTNGMESGYGTAASQSSIVQPENVLGTADGQYAGQEKSGAGERTVSSGTIVAIDEASQGQSPIQSPEKPEQLDLFEHRFLDQKSRANYRIIGQLFDTYWLIQFEDKLYIIDQHAAHEKVLYERTMRALRTKEYTSQLLSPPIILTLNMQEEELLHTYMDNFTALGFEIEAFGGREYAVRAVPDNLFSVASREVLTEMLDGLSSAGGNRVEAESINDRIATMSCKAAVKGNNRLSAREAEALIDELLNLENPYNCPHGRPTIVSMSQYELEKKFKRIV
ncbi:DNA mismatch repair endonuclease MutL [Oscillospiraceae bacterium Marseille-Q3528]|nr:DNA mismatch repair endonuclease MutL [Oscillospiraceae bacterium Marseille-Q3528]